MRFVDTNVVLHSVSRERDKAAIVREILQGRTRSVQVLQEFDLQTTRE